MKPVNRYLTRLRENFLARPDSIFCRSLSTRGEILLTWRGLEHACASYSAYFRRENITQDGQILIFLRDIPDMCASMFGAMAGGYVPAFMPCTSPKQDPRIYWQSHQELLRKIKPAAILADEPTFEEMRNAGLDFGDAKSLHPVPPIAQSLTFVQRDEASIALLQHSSGTTGLKKGVALSFGALADHAESYIRAIALTADDTIVSWLPLYHDMGLIACCIVPAFAGTSTVQIETMHWLGKPQLLLEQLQRAESSLCWLPNFAFEHLINTARHLASKFDLSNVRAFINCSEICKPATFDRFLATFAKASVRPEQLQCCYAMAEAVFGVTQSQLGEAPRRLRVDAGSLSPGSVITIVEDEGVELIESGKPLADINVEIFDEDRRSVPQGTVGEIGIQGRYLFSGYNFDSERTAASLEGGTYYSRDLGFLHDNRLFVLGRMDDLLIVNGRNLYAHEIEAVAGNIRGVKAGRAVAIAEFDARVGSNVLVVIVETSSVRSPEEIRYDIESVVFSTFAVSPRLVRVVPLGWLIKTTSGKISRKENQLKHRSQG